ncbi:MAG: Transcription elongation factor GreA [Microgenomates bacterium OLB23]|nr:MAG: Transcription elongation factor GreA [Microgenomates bacterium OLB23]
MSDQYNLSQEGYDKLIKELDELKNDKRPQAVQRLATARSMGDLSENSEYTAAKDDLGLIDSRIMEIEQIAQNAHIVEHHAGESTVQIGNKVLVKSDDSEELYHIVGEFEADITAGKISESSPIGKALLGAKVGTTVSVTIPAGTVTYKVVKID